MSALDKAREAAARAAEALTKAEAKANAEAAGVKDRNAARVAEFWSNAAERCQTAKVAAQDARMAVVDAAASGDLHAAQEAYPDYVRRTVEARTVVSAARAATAVYVWTERCKKDPDAKTGKRRDGQPGYHYPEMVDVEHRVPVADWTGAMAPPHGHRVVHAPGTDVQVPDVSALAVLLEEGLARLAAEHGSTFYTEYTAPLTTALEPAGS